MLLAAYANKMMQTGKNKGAKKKRMTLKRIWSELIEIQLKVRENEAKDGSSERKTD